MTKIEDFLTQIIGMGILIFIFYLAYLWIKSEGLLLK